MNRGVPILMYHALSAAHTAAFRRWTLAPDRFKAHLDYLSRSGYSTITIAELLRRRLAAQAGRDRVIVLTFDDAYADFHSVALPLLTRYGMTATLFVPTGHVGGSAGGCAVRVKVSERSYPGRPSPRSQAADRDPDP